MTAPGPAPGGSPGRPAPGQLGGPQDAVRWEEAARLRREHQGWSIIWLARAREFRACKRLRGARRDTGLADPDAAGLAAQITRAEQAARPALRGNRHD